RLGRRIPVRPVRLLATSVALIVIGMGIFEMTMQPTGEERIGALALFGMMAAGIAVAALALPRLARRLTSLKTTVVILGGTSLLILVFALAVAGGQMFISGHDLNLLWVLMGFGVVSALAFGLTVSGPLTEDLARISNTSSAIAEGDLGARTGVDRLDEAGRLAHDVDAMADALEGAARRRVVEEEARRALFAAVSHDLRTPLASMRAAIEALQDGLAENPHRFLESMEADVDALSRLVDDIFLMARLESGDIVLRPERIDLTEIADEAIEVFRPIASSRGVRVRLDAASRVEAFAGPEAVARVVRNLLDNAIRHSPTGGEVVIGVTNGPKARCTVQDEGPGFSAAFAARAFDRFTRDDTSRLRGGGGAGLGLAIARSYLDALGGGILAEPGPGGVVSFWLPVPEPAAIRSVSGSMDR
ncbi:MAG TPA: ATP-binding protein, partial [Acidimicrobiia bacterium]